MIILPGCYNMRNIVIVCTSISESVSEDNLFYIVSPKDVVVARQRDEDDHIAWLLQHEKYEVH